MLPSSLGCTSHAALGSNRGDALKLIRQLDVDKPLDKKVSC